MKYFRLISDDINAYPRWYLDCPVDENKKEIDPRIFTEGRKISGIEHLFIPLQYKGPHFDFNFAAFDMLVVPKKLNEELEKLPNMNIQRIPVTVEDQDQEYEILNILDLAECIDIENSEFTIFTKESSRPDREGEIHYFKKLIIDQEKAKEHNLFRLKEWDTASITNETVKNLIEKLGITGVAFKELK
jgi:hypothetical protein